MRDWLCPVPLLTNPAFNSLVCRCLHLACSEGNLKMVNLLFDYKATLDVYDRWKVRSASHHMDI